MLDALNILFTVDQFTLVTIVVSASIALWLIQLVVGSTALAIVCAPILILGALAANYLFRLNFVIAAQDKDTNVVVASAVGILVAMLLMLIGIWITVLMSDRRSQSKELMTLPDLPASGE